MDNMRLNSVDSSEDSSMRLQTIKHLIDDQNGEISLNLLFDIFQNLILDCKSVIPHNNNRYFMSLYKLYKKINSELYELRLNADDFYTLKVIGQGAFGQVQLVRHRETKKLFAMKILNKSQMMIQEGSVFWKEERDIMTGIDSKWVVKLHYAFQDPKRLYMVMEYLPGGNLVNWMSKLEDVFEADVCFYAAEIVLAICVLHDYNFVHRDIKPDNMLIDHRGHIKLADFGTCVRIDPVTKHITCNRAVGTPDYISPEVLQSQNGNTGYGREVDWWSLGVMLYEIFYGDPPFYSENLVQTYGKIMVHEQYLTFPPDDQISDRAVSLIRGLICDRTVRLGANDGAHDIKSHPFFKNPNNQWNWDNIHEFDAPFIPPLESELDTGNFDCQDDLDSKDTFNANDKELNSNTFCGENLQFSGFSYGDIFNQPERTTTKTPPTITGNKIVDESVANISSENKLLTTKIHSLSKENQDIKSHLEKLSIERKDLETQIQSMLLKLKSEVAISKKLQTDYSDLMSKHGLCQQKFSKLEEEKHKLCADLVHMQYKKAAWRLFNCTRPMNTSRDESDRLQSELEQQKKEIDSVNSRLSESVADYRKTKLENVKLENDLKYLQKRYDCLEQEVAQLQHLDNPDSIPMKQNLTYPQSRISLELKELRLDYDEKWKQLQQHVLENQAMSHTIADLQKENEQMRASLEKSEELNARNSVTLSNLNVLIKEKNSIIEDLKNKTETDHKKLELSIQTEKDLNVKLVRLSKLRSEDKQKFDHELEEQRLKLNTVICNKGQEMTQLLKAMELTTQENAALKTEIQLEKAKCSSLVEKINEVLTGRSSAAKEIMMAASRKVDKKSDRLYNQVQKENKKLQSLYNQLEKDLARKEKEYKSQIETLSREKEHVESENVCLKSSVAYYENIGVSDSAANRASLVTYSSHDSYDSGFPIDGMKATSTPIRSANIHAKPPFFSMASSNFSPVPSQSKQNAQFRDDKDVEKMDVTMRQNKMKTFDIGRLSVSESLSQDFPCPEGQLDVNVKVKGKKMSWEKRFVKIDSQSLLFYSQSLETCLLKVPLSSLVFVRQATARDVIHAKKGEIPRIFQICYDKNLTLYSEALMKQSMSGSSCSINTLGSSKSSGKGSVVNDLADSSALEFGSKRDHRKSSVSKFLPLFGAKSKRKAEELTMNSLGLGAVFFKGHIFEHCAADSKINCDVCRKPLSEFAPVNPSLAMPPPSSVPHAHSLNRELRVVTDTSSRTMNSSHLNRTLDLLSSTVDSMKTYKCFHCSRHVHGSELDDKTMVVCDESVTIQLCRASSEQQLAEWLSCLSHAMNMHTSTSGFTRAQYQTKSATLG